MSNQRPTSDLPGSQGVPAEDDRQPTSSVGTPSLGGSGTSSGTSSASLGQEPQELSHYRSLVKKLLDFIATGDEDAMASVISLIRTGASHDQILEEIDRLSVGSGLANSNTNGAHPGHS
ncbi:hypothetical protein N7520_010866 [Penicillium odoratum]|uniref:uncharacterized protein n=1 Tax=Penicillium odoratum TaxID=1167516 RepID=UPI0025493366|nr:uncharacterized protein N7520_010866 [Penicillium odoratum]KAJ5745684.1 hypothetical protein N7520_010866 [Penicillium odoratum]